MDEFGSCEEPTAGDPITPALKTRLNYEQTLVEDSPNVGFSRGRTAVAGAGLVAVAAVAGTTWVYIGVFGGLMAGEPISIAFAVITGAIALPITVWNTHRASYNDPDAAKPETALDKALVVTHAAVDKLVSRVRYVSA